MGECTTPMKYSRDHENSSRGTSQTSQPATAAEAEAEHTTKFALYV